MGFEPLSQTPQTGFVPLEAASSGFTPLAAPSAIKGYDPREDDTRDMLDPQGSLARKAEADPGIVPSRPFAQAAIGAALVPNQLETTFLAHPDNFAAQASPESQARLGQLKGDRQAAAQAISEIQAEDTVVGKMFGNALQSVPGSVATMVPAAMGLPVGPALALGLAGNYATETASDFTNRMDQFGQTPEDAWGPANLHGAVATGLELLPLHGAVKYMKGAAPIGKTVLKVGGGEFVQESATTGFDDTMTNAQGLTNYTPEQRAMNALESGIQGVLMGPFTMGVAHVVQKGAQYGAQKKLEEKILGFEGGTARKELETIFAKARAGVLNSGEEVPTLPLTPLTQEESTHAELIRAQMKDGLEVEPDTTLNVFAQKLNEHIGSNQAEGRTIAGEAEPNLDEGGVSQYVLEGRERRFNPNILEPAKRPFRGGYIAGVSQEEILGLTPEQVGDVPAGFVGMLGGTEYIFPTPVYDKLTHDLSMLVAKIMPEARILLNLEQFAGEDQAKAFGLHQLTITPQGLLHIITPRDMPSFKYQGGDYKTQMAVLTALHHEFGHALKMQTLYQGLVEQGGATLAGILKSEVERGELTADTLAQVRASAPETAAMVEGWDTLRKAVLAGKMTATQFVDSWVGVRKLGNSVARDLARQKSLYSWASERLGAVGKTLEGATAQELVLAGMERGSPEAQQAYLEQYLSLDEYMAEQFSRAAYASGELEQSRFGKMLGQGLARLRALFRDLKKDKVVAPGVTFQAWLDMQTERAKNSQVKAGTFKLSPKVKRAQKALAKKLEKAGTKEGQAEGTPPKTPPPPSPPEQAPVPVEVTATQIPTREALLAKADEMEATGAFYGARMGEEAALRSLRGMIERGQYEQARDKIEGVVGTVLHWDRDYSSKVLSRLPDKEKIKAVTLESQLKAADVKLKEKEFWLEFLARHPDGFSMAEAKEALANKMMPLELEYSNDHAEAGLAEVGLKGLGKAWSIIYKAPFETDSKNHWGNPNYVFHTRQVTDGDIRFVVEIQSDFWNPKKGNEMPQVDETSRDVLQSMKDDIETAKALIQETKEDGIVYEKPMGVVRLFEVDLNEAERVIAGGPETFIPFLEGQITRLRDLLPHYSGMIGEAEAEMYGNSKKMESMKGAWYERAVRESVTAAFGDGVKTLYYPDAETMAQVEGWPREYELESLKGRVVVLPDGIITLDGRVSVEGGKWRGSAEFGIMEANGKEYKPGSTWVVDEQASDEGARLFEELYDAKPSYGNMQDLYDMYKNAVEKYIKKQYKAEKEYLPGKGYWYKVDPAVQGDTVLNWDRDNPLNDRIGTRLAPHVGIQGRTQAPESQKMWVRLGTESPYFKSWFGESKIVKASGEPLGVWKSQSGSATPIAGTGKQAYWLHENQEVAGYSLAKKKEGHGQASPFVQEYYVRLENPMVVDAGGTQYRDQSWYGWLEEAVQGGYDGLVLENVQHPFDGQVYVVFEKEQMALLDNVRMLDAADSLHWDKDVPELQTVRGVAKLMQNFWEKPKLKALNTAAKATDYLIQLQQAAAGQPEDVALNSFVHLEGLSIQTKNMLQVDAEKLVADMMHSSPRTVEDLHRVLRAEWKGGSLQSTLVGLDTNGELAWGREAGTGHAQRLQVVKWLVVDGVGLRGFLKENGVDPETAHGKAVLDFYLRVRNAFLHQFAGLELALHLKAETLYENAPTVLAKEKWKIEELLSKLRDQPFLPQGNFGEYTITILKDQGPQGRGKRRFIPVRREHFENKEDWDIALGKWQAAKRGDETIQVQSHLPDRIRGIPLQLPNDLLETLGGTGMFTDSQIELMAEVLVKARYEKLEARYEKIQTEVEGANDDFIRVFADYSLRNSNYIWKLQYRTALRGAVALAKSEVRRLEKRADLGVDTQLALVERQRRNIGLMERALDYMLNPPAEFQNARLAITLTYLAFNAKTALMNFGTQLNTWAAISSEYGEWKGNKAYAQGLKDMGTLLVLDWAITHASPKEAVRLNEVKSVIDKATRQGVIDQSYAYFLAGQANSTGLLGSWHNSWMGRVGHVATETGMYPFKLVEKMNRIGSLLAFYHAERQAGADLNKAFDVAVQKTGLLQFDYTAANKPQLLRGKKSLAFMFASFTLSQGWILSGGYERASRAQARAAGRQLHGVWHGTTMKLWLLYLVLGGLMGVPFAENVMDLVQFAWRKLFGKTENIEKELRNFVADLGSDPFLVMHGGLHNVGGFDLSGSFGFGRPIPGTDLLNREWRSMGEALGNLGVKFAGPAGGFYSGMAKALGEFVDGNAGEGFKNIPGAVGSMAKATDAYLMQDKKPTYGITTKADVRLSYDADTGSFRDLTTRELMGMALGATPTMVSENREINFASLGESIYWNTRRSDLLDKYWTASRTEDEKMREEVRKTVNHFNESVPDRALRITGKQLNETRLSRQKAARMAEKYGTTQKSMRGVAGDTRESFGEERRR